MLFNAISAGIFVFPTVLCRSQHGDRTSVFRRPILQKCTLQGAFFRTLRHVDFFAGERVQACIVHARRYSARRWGEFLGLFGTQVLAAHELHEFQSVIHATAGVARHEIRHRELFFAQPLVYLSKHLYKFDRHFGRRFSHVAQHFGRGVFGCYFELTADM